VTDCEQRTQRQNDVLPFAVRRSPFVDDDNDDSDDDDDDNSDDDDDDDDSDDDDDDDSDGSDGSDDDDFRWINRMVNGCFHKGKKEEDDNDG